MKTIKCSKVNGGKCNFTIQAKTVSQAKRMFGGHTAVEHPAMIAKASDKDMKAWSDNFETNIWPNAKEIE